MLISLLSSLFIVGAVYGWGRLFDILLIRGRDHEVTSTVLLGAGGMGTILTTIGIFWFTPALVWSALAIGCGLAALAIYVSAGRGTPGFIDWLAVVIAGIPCAVVLVAGCAEPLGDIGNDTISYHLLGPEVWLRHARIEPVLDHSHTAFPALVEVLYACAMVIHGPSTVGAMSALFFCVLCALVYETTRWIGGSVVAARIAIGLSATMGALEFSAGSGFIDVPVACFILAGVRELFSRDRPRLVPAGALMGFGLASKYTGLMWLGIAAIVFASGEILSGKLFSAVRRTAVLAAVALVIGCPWYIRNYIELGSPIVPPPPGLSEVFSVEFMPGESVEKFHDYIKDRGKGVGRSFFHFLSLPFTLTLVPALFHCGAGNGVALLALSPVGVYVVARMSRAGLLLVAFAFLQSMAWFVTQQEMRFLIPVLAVCCACAAIGAAWLWPRSGVIIQGLIVVIILSSYGYGLLTEVRNRGEELGAVASEASAERRRQKMIPYRAAFDFLNRAPGVVKILIINPVVPPYYLDRDYIKVSGPYGELPYGSITIEQTLERVAGWGVTHLMDVEPFQISLDDSRFRLIFEGTKVRIFRLGMSSHGSGGGRRTTLLTALANGAPAVTTIGALSEPVWSDGAVAAAPAGDPDRLAGLALELHDCPARLAELGLAGRRLYEDRFAIRHTIATLLDPP